MRWKILSIVNTLLILTIGYFVFGEFYEMAARISGLEKENSRLVIATNKMQSEIEDLLQRVDHLNGVVNKLELSGAVSDLAQEADYTTPDVISSDWTQDGSPQPLPEVGFSQDMGDCSGVGKGLNGLFVDVFTKCPSDVAGFALKLSR